MRKLAIKNQATTLWERISDLPRRVVDRRCSASSIRGTFVAASESQVLASDYNRRSLPTEPERGCHDFLSWVSSVPSSAQSCTSRTKRRHLIQRKESFDCWQCSPEYVPRYLFREASLFRGCTDADCIPLLDEEEVELWPNGNRCGCIPRTHQRWRYRSLHHIESRGPFSLS